MAESWTLRRVIGWIQSDFERRNIESARLDADLIVAHALDLKRIALYLDLDRPLIDSELTAIRKLVERRRAYEPMAYLLGQKEFYGRPFDVDRAVLIPRPDTETLVESALSFLRAGAPEGPILDLCTGSGAVAITLALERPERKVVATDLSSAALAVAERNRTRHALGDRLELREGDLFGALPGPVRFACITANPPYIGAHELPSLAPDVRDFEPRVALIAGDDALAFYRRIAERAGSFLLPGGALLVEVGIGQAAAVSECFAKAGLVAVRTHRDLNGVERVVEAHASSAG